MFPERKIYFYKMFPERKIYFYKMFPERKIFFRKMYFERKIYLQIKNRCLISGFYTFLRSSVRSHRR